MSTSGTPAGPGYVLLLFCRRRRLGSVLLRAALWSAWSHCALVDGDHAIEAAAGVGVRRRSLQALLQEASEFAFVRVPCADPAAVIAAATTQLGKRYDWLGLLGIGLRRRWQRDDAWFCSELVAWAFEAAGHPLVRVRAWRITPRDLYLPLWRPGL
jgi:uncharacterized protein YycO